MVHFWDNLDFEIILRLLKGDAHLREISIDLSIPHSTVSRRIALLRKDLILDYKEEGKNNKYFLKKNLIVKKAVIMSENYKFIKISNKYPNILPILHDILEKTNCKMIILFGSYAKAEAREDSDIDIYIETTSQKEKETLEKINDSINIKIGKFEKENLLIKEIIKNHVILKGAEEYYEKIKFFE